MLPDRRRLGSLAAHDQHLPPAHRPALRGRRPAHPRQPRPAQRDVGPDDRRPGSPPSTSWPGTPRSATVVVTGAGTAFCSGGDTSWIAGEPDASVDRLRTRMIAFYRAWLSIRRLEVPTIAAVNGAAIGAGLCPRARLRPPLRRGRGQARRAVRQARHAPGDGLDPPVARTCSARPRRGTCCSPDGSSRPRRRCGWAWSPGCCPATASSTRPSRSPRGSPRRPRSRAGYTTLALRDGGHRDVEGAVQWEALAQPVTLATEDLQEGIRRGAGEAPAPVHRPLSGSKKEAPGAAVRRSPSPCERRPAVRGPFRAHARAAPRGGSTPGRPRLWTRVWMPCGAGRQPCGARRGRRCTTLWGTRPGGVAAGV